MPLNFEQWSRLFAQRRQDQENPFLPGYEEVLQWRRRIGSFLDSLQVGSIWVEGAVAVVSLCRTAAEPLPDPWLSASEALRRDVLEVREAQRASVPVLEMENRDPEHYVLIPSGQVFPGGMQTRGVAEEVALAPRQKANVPVYCVEQGRWGGPRKFAPDKKTYRSPARLHRAIAHKLSQSDLWEMVSSLHEALCVQSPSESLAELYEQMDHKIKKHHLAMKILQQLEPNACGVLLFYAGELKLAEVFAESALAEEQIRDQLRSFVIDVMIEEQRGRSRAPVALEQNEVQRRAWAALEHLQASPWEPYRRLGAGELWSVSSPQYSGQTLCCKQHVIHLLVVPALAA